MQIASSCPRSVISQESLQQVAIAVRQQTGYINLLMINAGMAGPGLSTPNPRDVVAEFIRNVWSIPMPVSRVPGLKYKERNMLSF